VTDVPIESIYFEKFNDEIIFKKDTTGVGDRLISGNYIFVALRFYHISVKLITSIDHQISFDGRGSSTSEPHLGVVLP